jgi:hypothetical protein
MAAGDRRDSDSHQAGPWLLIPRSRSVGEGIDPFPWGVSCLRADSATGQPLDRATLSLSLALAAIIHGSLGVTTRGVFNVAATNAYSITLVRAIVALLACLAICALLLGRRMFRMLLDRKRSRLTAELCLLPGAATGAAECSGTAAESIALLDTPVTDRSTS